MRTHLQGWWKIWRDESNGAGFENRSGMDIWSMSTGSAENRISWPLRRIFERSTQPVERLIPGAYKVGGRRVLQPTGQNRDSSLRISMAPGNKLFLPKSADRPQYI